MTEASCCKEDLVEGVADSWPELSQDVHLAYEGRHRRMMQRGCGREGKGTKGPRAMLELSDRPWQWRNNGDKDGSEIDVIPSVVRR